MPKICISLNHSIVKILESSLVKPMSYTKFLPIIQFNNQLSPATYPHLPFHQHLPTRNHPPKKIIHIVFHISNPKNKTHPCYRLHKIHPSPPTTTHQSPLQPGFPYPNPHTPITNNKTNPQYLHPTIQPANTFFLLF